MLQWCDETWPGFHILTSLYFWSNTNQADKTEKNYDRFWKIRSLFDRLNNFYTINPSKYFKCGWSYCILHRHNYFQAIYSQTSCKANDPTSSLIQWSLASQRTCLWCHVQSASKKGMITIFMSLKYKVGLCICLCFHSTYCKKGKLINQSYGKLERKEIPGI